MANRMTDVLRQQRQKRLLIPAFLGRADTEAEEDLVATWGYSFRQFGVVHADAYIGRIAAVLMFWSCLPSA